MIERYQKKPVIIETVQYKGYNKKEVINFVGDSLIDDDSGLYIKTLEGNHLCSVGDFIIKGVHGEFYPCKPDIFRETYIKVEK